MRIPKENVYICEYGCLNVTVDVDDGATPFMIKCRRKSTRERPIAAKYLGKDGECIGTAKSSFYPTTPRPKNIPDPEWEWYKPDTMEDVSEGEKQHVKNGGLLMRARTSREPVYHKGSLPLGKQTT